MYFVPHAALELKLWLAACLVASSGGTVRSRFWRRKVFDDSCCYVACWHSFGMVLFLCGRVPYLGILELTWKNGRLADGRRWLEARNRSFVASRRPGGACEGELGGERAKKSWKDNGYQKETGDPGLSDSRYSFDLGRCCLVLWLTSRCPRQKSPGPISHAPDLAGLPDRHFDAGCWGNTGRPGRPRMARKPELVSRPHIMFIMKCRSPSLGLLLQEEVYRNR
ncbi:hypothetical protein QBC37DRAFT_125233 [Rhypophila decipiens]|uniref:Uncharacterized protein n=1 Tax=Rhypophila decipiens TaxID=261697 RepID=A0AAN6YB44_9PEZI|nr:hypothetical protein QBC37DRAFT_125233 [Rhypophila decipiens]